MRYSWTIYYWMRTVREGTLAQTGGELRPRDRSPGEKLQLVIEGNALTEEQRGDWLREQGLHSEHLTEWEQELRRKDKALAEMAALDGGKPAGCSVSMCAPTEGGRQVGTSMDARVRNGASSASSATPNGNRSSR